jgi:superfamily II DNA or RNA helicase/HKD family nuclease
MTQFNDNGIFTNQDGTLLDRFKMVFTQARALDVVVGYFRMSGFNQLYKDLSSIDNIRILVGLSVDQQTFTFIDKVNQTQQQLTVNMANQEVIETYAKTIADEVNAVHDERAIRESHRMFVEMIQSGKLEIRAHPSRNIHAKVYIIRNKPGTDYGRFITGSSNFSANGFVDQYEFNVEFKNAHDVRAAEEIFDRWWAEGVDVTQGYVDAGKLTGPLNDAITPYQIYLKFLTEYFRNHLIDRPSYDTGEFGGGGFKRLQYQTDAVFAAQQILTSYGGVFLADVVGLGKTYMAALLAMQLDGPCLVIAPPALLDTASAGSWVNVFRLMGVSRYKCVSIGKLQQTIDEGVADFKYVIVDESHRFKSNDTQRYLQIKEICQGKGVILLSATPYNNRPEDILSQLSLFQDPLASTIPGVRNLNEFFARLAGRIQGVNRLTDAETYLALSRQNAQELRNKVLRYVMVRRTRSEIATFYADDLKAQNITFPEVKDPIPLFYQLTPQESRIYDLTMKMLEPGALHYARYQPITKMYYSGKGDISEQGARNLAGFMRILLVKRLESSFFAFKQTLHRFIQSYEYMLQSIDQGWVYTSKKYSGKMFELIERGDFDSIDELIAEERAEKYPAKDFTPLFRQHLREDLDTLRAIEADWLKIDRDPKWDDFKRVLQTNRSDGLDLRDGKLVIFSEFSDTAERLVDHLRTIEPRTVLFSSRSKDEDRTRVVRNFDANVPVEDQADDIRIIVTTDVLAEGVNMHRSQVVINYDLPWNPSKLMQRVGRVNRVGTKFSTLYTLNFFPSDQGDNQIALTESARAKITAFIHLLGNDARLLEEEEEIVSHQYFDNLNSKSTINGPDSGPSETHYLQLIRQIKIQHPELYREIVQLPRKIFSARARDAQRQTGLVSYFRHGELDRFWGSAPGQLPRELDFFEVVALLEALPTEKRGNLDEFAMFEALNLHKQAEAEERQSILSASANLSLNASRILKFLSDRQFKLAIQPVVEKRTFVDHIKKAIQSGRLESPRLKRIHDGLSKTNNPDQILSVLRTNVPDSYLRDTKQPASSQQTGYDGVVLAEYFS